MEARNRSIVWLWCVSTLLLLATMVNYMDRQTLSNLAVRIKAHFELSNEQYGDIEFIFGLGFAVGSLFFGILADRVGIAKPKLSILTRPISSPQMLAAS